MSETQDPEDIQREALDNACERVHFFQGKRLYPFSFARQTAAQRLDMSSDSPLESQTLLVYLCTLGDEIIPGTTETGIDRIDKARGEAGVRLFRRQMNEWADANGIKLGSAVAKELKKICDEIWTDLFRSETIPETSGGHAPKKSKR